MSSIPMGKWGNGVNGHLEGEMPPAPGRMGSNSGRQYRHAYSACYIHGGGMALSVPLSVVGGNGGGGRWGMVAMGMEMQYQ